jgi:hypothetical protein
MGTSIAVTLGILASIIALRVLAKMGVKGRKREMALGESDQEYEPIEPERGLSHVASSAALITLKLKGGIAFAMLVFMVFVFLLAAIHQLNQKSAIVACALALFLGLAIAVLSIKQSKA